jgi:hypothetical protein
VRLVHHLTMYPTIAWAVFHVSYEIWRTIAWKEGDINIAFGGQACPARSEPQTVRRRNETSYRDGDWRLRRPLPAAAYWFLLSRSRRLELPLTSIIDHFENDSQS